MDPFLEDACPTPSHVQAGRERALQAPRTSARCWKSIEGWVPCRGGSSSTRLSTSSGQRAVSGEVDTLVYIYICVCVTLGIIGILSDCFLLHSCFPCVAGACGTLVLPHATKLWARVGRETWPVSCTCCDNHSNLRALLVPKTRNPAFAPACSRQSRIGLWFRTTSLCRSVVRRFL